MANYYINATEEMNEIKQRRESLLYEAADKLSSVLMKMNKQGESNMRAIEGDIKKLISGFSEEEKNSILLRAITKLIINL